MSNEIRTLLLFFDPSSVESLVVPVLKGVVRIIFQLVLRYKVGNTMRAFVLALHFIGVAMCLGTSIGYLFLGLATSSLEKGEAQSFTLRTMALSKMGHIGLILLICSGVFLMTPYWEQLSETPLLIAKLCLVGVLSGLVGIIAWFSRKATIGDTEKNLRVLKPLGSFTLLTGVSIVLLAVLVFR